MKGFKFPHQFKKFKTAATQTEKQCKNPTSKPPVLKKEKCNKPTPSIPDKKCDFSYSRPTPEKEKCNKPITFPPTKCFDFTPPKPEKNCKSTPSVPSRDYSQPSYPARGNDTYSGGIISNNVYGNGNTTNNNITVNNNYFTINLPQSA
jgi:hypothetical protein